MYDDEQISHIRNLCLIEYNEMKENKNKQNSLNKYERRSLALYYSMISIMVAVVSQYVIDVIFKLLNKTNIKDLFKVTYPWQVYYSIVIASAFTGMLKVYLPSKLFAIAAVITTTIIYQTVAYLTGEETLTSEELVESIIADIFIVQLILYIINRLIGNSQNKTKNGIGNIFVVTLVSSIVINVASFLSKNAYSTLFNFRTNNGNIGIVLDKD